MKIAHALLLTCCLTPACLENEESIEVRPNGSVRVTLRAKGDVEDLTQGHALPLHGPWQPVDQGTRTWVEVFGAATGGAEVRARFDAGAWSEMGDPDEEEVELSVQAEFPSVSDLPTFLSPAGEPYRDALLARDTNLSITQQGARRVYVFERAYAGRPFWDRFDDEVLPEPLKQGLEAALEAQQRPSEDLLHQLSAVGREWARTPPAMQVFTSALGALYTEGEGGLSCAAHARVLERLHASVAAVLSPENLGAFFEALFTAAENETALPAELDLEQQLRTAIRITLKAALADAGLDLEVRNAVLERLEWNFTSYDIAQDIGDEKFTLNLTLPGTIVDGNYDELEGHTARWTFEGSELHGADRVLRAVSVLE